MRWPNPTEPCSGFSVWEEPGVPGKSKREKNECESERLEKGPEKSVPPKEGIDSRIKEKSSPDSGSRMSVQRIYYISRVALVLIAVCVLTATTVVAGQQQDEQKSNNRNSQSLSGSSLSSSSSSFGAAGSSPNNDIYIDDEGLEGSGSRGEIRDDLEKEDDESSGSGYGDDDEDSSSISSSSNSRSNANVGIISRDGGQGGGAGTGQITNNQLGGGQGQGQGQGQGSGDHADYDDEDDDREDDDLYTETKNPNAVDPSTTDDEDMSTGGTGGKDGKSSSSAGTSIKHSPDGDLELPTLLHSPTNVEGGGHGGTGQGGSGGHDSNNPYGGSGVLIMNAKNEDRTASFFAQPGILAAVIGGAVVGLLCAILVVMFIVYRMRKKDEGSYALDEPKRSPTANTYAKNANNREFYA